MTTYYQCGTTYAACETRGNGIYIGFGDTRAEAHAAMEPTPLDAHQHSDRDAIDWAASTAEGGVESGQWAEVGDAEPALQAYDPE